MFDTILVRTPLPVSAQLTTQFRDLLVDYYSAESLFLREGDKSHLEKVATEEEINFLTRLCDPRPCTWVYMDGDILVRDQKFDILDLNTTFAIVRFDYAWSSDPNSFGWMCDILLNTKDGWKVDSGDSSFLPPVCPIEKDYIYSDSRILGYLNYLLSKR
jgi:hypothetical protein